MSNQRLSLAMKRFEYHIFKLGASGRFVAGEVDTAIMDKRINEFGADGRGLVLALDTNAYHGARET